MGEPSKQFTLDELELALGGISNAEPFYLDDDPIDFAAESSIL